MRRKKLNISLKTWKAPSEFVFSGNGAKSMNSILGHSMQDIFLRNLSRNLQKKLGDRCIAIKKSQTEFTVLLSREPISSEFDIRAWYRSEYKKFLSSITTDTRLSTNESGSLSGELLQMLIDERTDAEQRNSPLGECVVRTIS